MKITELLAPGAVRNAPARMPVGSKPTLHSTQRIFFNLSALRASITIGLAPAALLGLSLSTVHAQTAFTYQGQLLQTGNPASGIYNLTFSLFSVSSGGSAVAGPFTVNGVNVTNGLFTVLIDFGSGVFYGQPRWLDVGVETNGGASFDTLTPRLLLTPAPLSLYAANAAAAASATNWSGSVSGDVLGTQGATVVASVGGQTAASVASGVLAANGATSNNVPGTLVARDATGSFSAGSITLSGGLYLPYPATIYSGSNTLLIDQGSLFLGHPAGGHGATGLGQTGIGDDVLISGSSGNYNTALGEQAMQYNTSGDQNTANGYQALQGNTIGQLNTAIGAFALLDNTSGTFNTAVGGQTLQFNTTSSGNTAVGYQALFSNTTGGSNTANGFYALVSNSGGSYDTANGVFALEANSNGTYNTADGAFALANNTSGSNNTAIGGQALQNNTIGSDNTASGLSALSRNTNGSANTANGAFALANNTSGSANTANGAQALQANTSGTQNTASGDLALFSNTSGSDNTANGYQALYLNTNGWDNTANGSGALYQNSNGSNNAANGSGALYANTGGSYNTADGSAALGENTTGNFNTALGYWAGGNIITGSFNIDIGNPGFSTDGYIIRIGAEGTQTNAFVAGIYETALPSSGLPVFVDQFGQLGTTGTVPINNLPGNGKITVNTGTGLFGGGIVPLGGSITLSNAGVLSVSGAADGYVTASAANGNVTLDLGNLSASNTPGAIVVRDTNGSITASSATFSGALNLPDPGVVYSGSNLFVIEEGSLYVGKNGGSAIINGADTLHNTGFGDYALNTEAISASGGNFNTAVGDSALVFNATGFQNTAIGYAALSTNVAGADNTAVGYLALCNNNASGNTAIGWEALLLGKTGGYNTADGTLALANSVSGSNNIALGYEAGINLTTGSSNIDVGNGGVSGDNNITRIGTGQSQAFIAGDLFLSGNGSANEALNVSGNTRLNNYNIYFRSSSDANHGVGFFGTGSVNGDFDGVNVNGPVLWGNGGGALGVVAGSSQAIALYWNAGEQVGIGTTSPDATLSVNGTADKPGGGSWGTFSDARLKDIGADFVDGLDALNKIQPVHYHYKTGNPLNLASQPEYVGVVAQQVESAVPEAVQRNQDGYLVVNNDPIIWTMLNAVKELNQKREAEANEKDAEIRTLKRQNDSLAARLSQLETTVKSLAEKK